MSRYGSTTISKAMSQVASNHYLIPALQRKFVWSTEQIEMLFDSLMRDYPINSFMFWKVDPVELRNSNNTFKFYSLIRDYAQRFNEDNIEVPANMLNENFIAIIDGQQRMNSLYIGLGGSYRYKRPNKQWRLTEEAMPTRRLYLDLLNCVNSNIDNSMHFNFKFLTDNEAANSTDYHWFKVGEICNKNYNYVITYLYENNLINNEFSRNTLNLLWNVINEKEIINYYEVESIDIDVVLDMFLRTNSGGTKLSFSDLLMSISSANWENLDAREEIADTINQIRALGNPSFEVSQDFILKSMLVISDVDVKFKLTNFNRNNIKTFEDNWKRIQKSIVVTFELLKNLGFNDDSVKAKNAVIPIAYYIYKNNLEDDILKPKYFATQEKIRKWLILTLLKGIFGGQSDNVLSAVREVIRNSNTGDFPIDEIKNRFRTDPDKNYSFTDEVIEDWLTEQYHSPIASLLLLLLYPSVVNRNGDRYAQDHIHPKALFAKRKLDNLYLAVDDYNFYSDKKNYNSLLNLQLLEEIENKNKSDKLLSDWVTEKGKTCNDLYVEQGTSFQFEDFKAFIESRRRVLLAKIRDLVN